MSWYGNEIYHFGMNLRHSVGFIAYCLVLHNTMINSGPAVQYFIHSYEFILTRNFFPHVGPHYMVHYVDVYIYVYTLFVCRWESDLHIDMQSVSLYISTHNSYYINSIWYLYCTVKIYFYRKTKDSVHANNDQLTFQHAMNFTHNWHLNLYSCLQE